MLFLILSEELGEKFNQDISDGTAISATRLLNTAGRYSGINHKWPIQGKLVLIQKKLQRKNTALLKFVKTGITGKELYFSNIYVNFCKNVFNYEFLFVFNYLFLFFITTLCFVLLCTYK